MAELKSLVDSDSRGSRNDELETAIALNLDDYSQQPIFSKLSLPCIIRILNKCSAIHPELAARITHQIYLKNKGDVVEILKIIKIDGDYSEFVNRLKSFVSDADNLSLWMTINRGNTFSFTRDYSIIASKCQKDLEIVNYNKSFFVNSFMASRCSQLIFSRVIEDISINKIYTEIDSSIIQYFIDYLNGNYREYTSNIDYNFIKAVVFFKIQSLLGISVYKYFKTINISEKMSTLYYIFKNGMNISNILQFALEDYSKFTAIIKKLSQEALNDLDFIAQILQNPFTHHKPEKTTKFILERIKIDKKAVKLLKYCSEIDFQNSELIELINDKNFNLNYLRKSLVSQNYAKDVSKDLENKIFEYNFQYPQFGLLYSIGNVKLSASASAPSCEVENILDLSFNNYYCSLNDDEPYIQFDFHPLTVKVTGISIRAADYGSTLVSPSVLSFFYINEEKVTNLFCKLEIKDKLWRTDQLQYFKLEPNEEPSSVIKIVQNDAIAKDQKLFAVSFIEFYGEICN